MNTLDQDIGELLDLAEGFTSREILHRKARRIVDSARAFPTPGHWRVSTYRDRFRVFPSMHRTSYLSHATYGRSLWVSIFGLAITITKEHAR